MSFGSQERVKSPTSRVLKKIADSENNVNNQCNSPIEKKERPEFENIESMIQLNSNSINPSLDSEQ